MHRRSLAVFLLLCLAPSCRSRDSADPPLLTLGDEVVRRSEFEHYVRDLESRGGALTPEVRDALLDAFLEERVLVLEARRRGFVKAGTSADAERAAVERLVGEAALKDTAVNEGEVQAYYDVHKAEFTAPEEVALRHILVGTSNEVRDVRRRLAKDPSSFEALARSLSRGPEAIRGGDMGAFSRGQLPAELDALAFSLPVGAVGDVQSALGYHVLKVEARHPARETSLDGARAAIRTKLAREKSDLQVRRFVSDLLQLSRAKVDHEARRPAPRPS